MRFQSGIRGLIKAAYFRVGVTDQNATVIILALLGLQVERHRHRVGAVAKGHAVRVPVVACVNSPGEGTREQHSDVHGARLAGGRHLGRKVDGHVITDGSLC